MSTTDARIALRDRPAYQALERHYADVRARHLRELFARGRAARHAPDRGGRGHLP